MDSQKVYFGYGKGGFTFFCLSLIVEKSICGVLCLMDDDDHFFYFLWLFTEYDPYTFAKAQNTF